MRIGIDLGGTKTEILCLSPTGEEIYRKRIASAQGVYEQTVHAIRSLVLEAESHLNQTGSVGIGIPGTVSVQTGLVKNANSTWLIGHPFQTDLSQALNREVRMSNDANCFALSEAVDGAAHDAKTVFGVILGTGVGGGLVMDQQVIGGINSVAGEWGHNTLAWPTKNERPGAPCYCGHTGCIETFLSGPALSRQLFEETAQKISPKDLNSCDPLLIEPVLKRYEHRLARALASVINLFDPEAIVLGGGLSNIDRWYETVPRLWDQWVFGNECETRLLKARHGDASGVRGAAWLWPPAGEQTF